MGCLTTLITKISLKTAIEVASKFKTTLEILKSLLDGPPVGNRWFKVNLHVHALGNDSTEIVRRAREASIDLLAITDHQSFDHCDAVIAAATTPGPTVTILPGIEITSHEGVHVLAVFPQSYGAVERTRLLGWLEIAGGGDTKIASGKNLSDIFKKVRDEGGILIVPHPFTAGIGMLDSARKLSTKVDWLESGHVGLMQIAEDKVQYVDCDAEGNWINRYVLSSANSVQIKTSNYCLAPFSRSDAHKPEEIPDGCSWFRMGEPTVEGLKQVCCEPRSRICRTSPPASSNDTILAMRVTGGYSDGQFFSFNTSLNCIVGQNYAGKSAVFDFARFALGIEESLDPAVRGNLLNRLNGILGAGGCVELFVRSEGNSCVLKRTFNPQVVGSGSTLTVQSCLDQPMVYRYDPPTDSLMPTPNLKFPVEVYEQGRISRLRDDVGRQLEMLDEFAGLSDLRKRRSELVSELRLSAEVLAPLYEEREGLKGEIGGLPQLQQELEAKEELMQGADDHKWAEASAFVGEVETVENELTEALEKVPSETSNLEHASDLERLFSQAVPELNPDEVVKADLLSRWRDNVKGALTRIEVARSAIAAAIETMVTECKQLRWDWQQALSGHQKALAETLRKAGVESPQELITRVNTLRTQIAAIQVQKQPRLAILTQKSTRRNRSASPCCANWRALTRNS